MGKGKGLLDWVDDLQRLAMLLTFLVEHGCDMQQFNYNRIRKG